MAPKRSSTKATVACARCGTTATCAPGGIPAGWSIETERERVFSTCGDCIRRNLRALEAKLPQEYWEW